MGDYEVVIDIYQNGRIVWTDLVYDEKWDRAIRHAIQNLELAEEFDTEEES